MNLKADCDLGIGDSIVKILGLEYVQDISIEIPVDGIVKINAVILPTVDQLAEIFCVVKEKQTELGGK